MDGRGYGGNGTPGNSSGGDLVFERERQRQYPGTGGFAGEGGNRWGYGGGGQRSFHRGGIRQGICIGWRQTGKCSYGDRCRFYHEQHVESQPAQHTGGSQELPGLAPPAMRHEGERERGFPGAGRFAEGMRPPWDRERPPIRDGPHFKTKLCDKFQQLGHCPYEERCTFAHGHQELRPFPRPHFDGSSGAPGPGMGGDAYKAHPSQMGGLRGTMHGTALTPRGSPRSGAPGGTPTGPKVVDITYLDRVRAVNHILGIGEAANVEPKPGSVQAALHSIKTGAAFRESLYADSVEDFIPQ